MLKKRVIEDEAKRKGKPQYKLLERLKSQLQDQLYEWIFAEYEISQKGARFLASDIGDRIIRKRQAVVSVKDPDTVQNDKDALSGCLDEAIALTEQLNAINELELILERFESE